MAALPLVQASQSGVTPKTFATFAFAPDRIRRSAVCTSSRRAAQCSAVVPSASAAFTSSRRCRRVRTVDVSPFLTASINRPSVGAAPRLATASSATTHHPRR